ncbi:hypothetical protein HO173_009562 [Letharia columbiana]|uniref:Uncharacterized protein n=1 Tax=Letharia columbiana TaxID=112416 RepID=A0A8H6FP94_9LECA|nr:uncharacterized protein HO173_009562 [Letharia columbiana]KAF6232179.1 hypothetical protein HO173_009562 [Letharia columbiana]
MDENIYTNAYSLPTDTAKHSYSQRTGFENQQMAPSNTFQAQQHGRPPSHSQGAGVWNQQTGPSNTFQAQQHGYPPSHSQRTGHDYPPSHSQRTGFENRQTAPSNTFQAQQHGYPPSHLQPHQPSYGSQSSEFGFGQMHGQHSYQHQHQQQYQPSYYGTQSPQIDFGQPHVLSNPGLQPRPSYGYPPPYGGLGQPRLQNRHSHLGFPPQQAVYGHPHVVEQHPRHGSQPQQTGYGQPLPQSQQPFESRGATFGQHHVLQRQPKPAFRPLKTGSDEPSQHRAKLLTAQPQPTPPTHTTPAAIDFDSMSKKELKEWSRENGLPCSHLKGVLIQQAKQNAPIKTTHRGQKNKKKVTFETSEPTKGKPVKEVTETESDTEMEEMTNEFTDYSQYLERHREKNGGTDMGALSLEQYNGACDDAMYESIPYDRYLEDIKNGDDTTEPIMSRYEFEIQFAEIELAIKNS